MSVNASTFHLSGNIPSPVILCPKKITSDLLNRHFFLMSFKPWFLIDLKTLKLFCFLIPQEFHSKWLYHLCCLQHLQCFVTIGIFYFDKHHLLNECHMAYAKNDNDHWRSWKSIALSFHHRLVFANMHCWHLILWKTLCLTFVLEFLQQLALWNVDVK